MVRKFELYNNSDLSHLGEINIVNEPEIFEEINGSFNLEFEIDYRDRAKLNENVLVKADGQYFQIARIVKSRYDTITLSVYCEHVSYQLIVEGELEEAIEYESDAQTMISSFLEGTPFRLVSCIPTEAKYYTTNTLDKRKRLFDGANLFGGELVFDNFDVSLVQRRGSDKGLNIELGVNLLGVTEEINFVEGRKGYEIDLVDLSKVTGYELDFSAAELGDTITVIDNKLGINTNERILSIEYNPFKKALPTVSIGDYIPDLTEYFKDDEEDEEDDDPRANYWLEEFKVGDIDCLEIDGVEIDRDELIEDGLIASVDFNEYEKLTGVHVRLKPAYSQYHVTVYKVMEDDYETLDYATNQSSLNALKLPTETITGIGVLVTEVPLNQFDADTHKFGQYGVKFNRAALDVFREVRVGKVNALKLDDVALFPPLDLPDGIIAEVPFEEGTTLTGLFVSMKQKFKDWYVKLTTYNEAGTPTEYNLADVEAAAKTWNLPNSNITAIALTAMEKLPSEFVEGEHAKQTIAFKFFAMEPEANPSDYFEVIRTNDYDLLNSVGVETSSIRQFVADGFNTTPIATAKYEIPQQQTYIQAILNEEYQDYYIGFVESFTNPDGTRELFFGSQVNTVYVTHDIPFSDAPDSFMLAVCRIPLDQVTPETFDENVVIAFGVELSLAGDTPPDTPDNANPIIYIGRNRDRIENNTPDSEQFITTSLQYGDYVSLGYLIANYVKYDVTCTIFSSVDQELTIGVGVSDEENNSVTLYTRNLRLSQGNNSVSVSSLDRYIFGEGLGNRLIGSVDIMSENESYIVEETLVYTITVLTTVNENLN